MDDMFRNDIQARRRYIGQKQSQEDWERVPRTFEQKGTLKARRFNSGHCSYFHRWFQHPIWRFGQARVGNGPYSLAGEHHELVTGNWE
eukprot:2371103-Amphidinium_carterae.1